jgi:hypothetical protein
VAVRFKVDERCRQRAFAVPVEDALAVGPGNFSSAREGVPCDWSAWPGANSSPEPRPDFSFGGQEATRLLRAGDQVRDRFGEDLFYPGMFLSGGDPHEPRAQTSHRCPGTPTTTGWGRCTPRLAKSDFLKFYAAKFPVVEERHLLRIPPPGSFETMARKTPGFVFGQGPRT